MKVAKKKHYIPLAILSLLFIMVSAYVLSSFPTQPKVCLYRLETITIVYLFLAMHCLIDIKRLYDFIYQYRILIAIVFLIFCVANCFTGSSVSMYDSYIQPNSGGELVQPIWGTPRAIRSDEWLVNISRVFAGSYNNYGAVNDIVRGVPFDGISATGGILLDYSALRTPAYWGYYLFGPEYGNSFEWCYKFIIGGLIIFELCMILTKNRLYSLFGMVLVWFSPFNLWWSLCSQMYTAAAIVVFFYYTLKADNWKKRLLFGTILAISGADFCTQLYPAWQVPFGWVVVSLLVWLLIENQEWKKFNKWDWLVIVVDVIFMASIILRFLDVNSSYVEAISQTVYPGHRVSYGGFYIDKLLGYPISLLQGIVEFTNASEISTFFGVFPLGLVLSLYVLWKEKGKDSLIICLLIPSIVFILYTTIGLPAIIAKITLLTNSTAKRCVDILGFVSALLTIISLSRLEKMEKVPRITAFVLTTLCVIPVFVCGLNEEFVTKKIVYVAVAIIMMATFIIIYLLLCNKNSSIRNKTTIISCVILFSLSSIITPVTVGYDAITEKPVYKKVREILSDSDERTLWIGVDSRVNQNYLIACGAPTLNSTNYVPNHLIWDALDIENFGEEYWNRYAHVVINLNNPSETTAELTGADSITIDITPEDIIKLNVDYVLGFSGISSAYDDVLNCIYDEDGIAIYEVIK